MPTSRRAFLSGLAGASGLAALTACSSVRSGVNGTSETTGSTEEVGSKADLGPQTGELTFAFWGGSTGETAGFQNAKDKFEAANPGAKITLKTVPYDGFFAGIDRGLQSNTAPDVFRVDYTTIGKYSSKNVLLDMTPYFTDDEVSAFLPALWEGIKFSGVPYGVPHQTDTSCIVYDKDILASVGVTTVPDSLENAWTWEEFGDIAGKLRSKLPATKFPFAYNWTQAGAYRWLSWHYEAGGTVLNEDLNKSAFDSEAATKALDFTKSFFANKWVPNTNTVKTSKYSDDFFRSGLVAMTFVGDFLVPALADPKSGYKGQWAATYLPRDKGAAADLGGNAIVARKDTKNPDLAAAFLKFLVAEDQMKYFCEQAIELPTLKSLATADLQYASRPDVVKVCAEQASTISDTIVRESTVSAFNTINSALQDQLEQAFTGTDTAKVVSGIDTAINQAVGG
ncbi:ABC transporter substrate-binding protein [Jatrophihabitans sp. YIM 134969]